jgi:hypothetical protein
MAPIAVVRGPRAVSSGLLHAGIGGLVLGLLHAGIGGLVLCALGRGTVAAPFYGGAPFDGEAPFDGGGGALVVAELVRREAVLLVLVLLLLLDLLFLADRFGGCPVSTRNLKEVNSVSCVIVIYDLCCDVTNSVLPLIFLSLRANERQYESATSTNA